jgi:hypothetical protein
LTYRVFPATRTPLVPSAPEIPFPRCPDSECAIYCDSGYGRADRA